MQPPVDANHHQEPAYQNDFAPSSAQNTAPFAHSPYPDSVEIRRTFQPSGMQDQRVLHSTNLVPEPYRAIFKGYPFFNVLQSKVYEDVFTSNQNLVVSAPTGSGKTGVFEMCIIKMLMDHPAQPFVKAVYLAPIKALCDEKFADWTARFGQIGKQCCKMTGDTEDYEYKALREAQIVIATPEKWDSMTRKRAGLSQLMTQVRLFLVDEVHLVGDPERGATLEAVITRMKLATASGTNNKPGGPTIRFVVATATLKNVEDFGQWLSFGSSSAKVHKFGNEIRPVTLRRIVEGYPYNKKDSEFKFDMNLNYRLAEVISKYSNRKPTLVFCSSRKGVGTAAKVLWEASSPIAGEAAIHLKRAADAINGKENNKDSGLKNFLLHGIGMHHAGMLKTDRALIEDLFLRGCLPVLFCTSTLAMGVNLPAHLIIIKSTTHWVNGKCVEYSDAEITQMMGRAGRPQFDTSGTAVIMTQFHKKIQYEKRFSGEQIIESCLHKTFAEHVNAEISLLTFQNTGSLYTWLQATYFFIRLFKNPTHYELEKGPHDFLKELCETTMRELKGAGMIQGTAESFGPTARGNLMARFYISFGTMKVFATLKGTETIPELLSVICKSDELTSDVQLRVGEKMALNALNKSKEKPTIRYPIKGKIKTVNDKIYCLIQASLGALELESLSTDANKIFRNVKRLFACLSHYVTPLKFHTLAVSTIVLAKCMESKMWEDSSYVSRQLVGIGPVMSSTLAANGYQSFAQLENGNPRMLESLCNRKAPFGNILVDAAKHLPKYALNVRKTGMNGALIARIQVELLLLNHVLIAAQATAGKKHAVFLIVGDGQNNLLLRQRITDTQLISSSGVWKWNLEMNVSEELTVQAISETMVGLDVFRKFKPSDGEEWGTLGECPKTPPQAKASDSKQLKQTTLKFPMKRTRVDSPQVPGRLKKTCPSSVANEPSECSTISEIREEEEDNWWDTVKFDLEEEHAPTAGEGQNSERLLQVQPAAAEVPSEKPASDVSCWEQDDDLFAELDIENLAAKDSVMQDRDQNHRVSTDDQNHRVSTDIERPSPALSNVINSMVLRIPPQLSPSIVRPTVRGPPASPIRPQIRKICTPGTPPSIIQAPRAQQFRPQHVGLSPAVSGVRPFRPPQDLNNHLGPQNLWTPRNQPPCQAIGQQRIQRPSEPLQAGGPYGNPATVPKPSVQVLRPVSQPLRQPVPPRPAMLPNTSGQNRNIFVPNGPSAQCRSPTFVPRITNGPVPFVHSPVPQFIVKPTPQSFGLAESSVVHQPKAPFETKVFQPMTVTAHPLKKNSGINENLPTAKDAQFSSIPSSINIPRANSASAPVTTVNVTASLPVKGLAAKLMQRFGS